jgi:membrane protease YdiL (CAAX protease family)
MERPIFDESTYLDSPAQSESRVYVYCAVACVVTWLLATPLALEWMRHEPQSALAVACAGFSAFGPLIAVLVTATRRERREAFGRWRTSLHWIALALAAPLAIHLIATALFAALGGQPTRWLHPPVGAEALAALVVFPLGEEFGWRGFAYPKMAARFGLVRGSLLLGLVWGVWHLAYGVTPEKGAFDIVEFGVGMLELPLYSLLIAWVMERSHRSMAVALAFHAGGHLDHIERDPSTGLLLHGCHLAVLVVLAALAARSLGRRDPHDRRQPSRF